MKRLTRIRKQPPQQGLLVRGRVAQALRAPDYNTAPARGNRLDSPNARAIRARGADKEAQF